MTPATGKSAGTAPWRSSSIWSFCSWRSSRWSSSSRRLPAGLVARPVPRRIDSAQYGVYGRCASSLSKEGQRRTRPSEVVHVPPRRSRGVCRAADRRFVGRAPPPRSPGAHIQCSPAPADCAGWYRTSVTVKWGWFTGDAVYFAGDCAPNPDPWVTFSADTAAHETWCEVKDGLQRPDTPLGHSAHRQDVPGVGAVTARPPTTEGGSTIRSQCCSRAATRPREWRPARARPMPADAVGRRGVRNCQDVAGNVGTGSFALNYDATPPAPRPSMPCRAIARSRSRGRPRPIRPLRSSASHGTGPLSWSIRGRETPSPIDRSATGGAIDMWSPDRPGRQPGCRSGQQRPDRVRHCCQPRGSESS